MPIDLNQGSLRLAANPLAVARQVDTLPPVALCILRLLDGHKTVRDTISMSQVNEATARAVLRRLVELGLAAPVGTSPLAPGRRRLSEPLRAWMSKPRARQAAQAARAAKVARTTPSEMDEVDALFAELAEPLQSPRPAAPQTPPIEVTATPQLADRVERPMADALGWTEQELAFFDSYAPEEPMTDTFSDLVSRPRRR